MKTINKEFNVFILMLLIVELCQSAIVFNCGWSGSDPLNTGGSGNQWELEFDDNNILSVDNNSNGWNGSTRSLYLNGTSQALAYIRVSGLNLNTCGVRFSIKLNSSLGNGEYVPLLKLVNEYEGVVQGIIRIEKTSGNLRLVLLDDAGNTAGVTGTLSTGTTYQVEILFTRNTLNGLSLRLWPENGSSQIGSTLTCSGTTPNYAVTQFRLGESNGLWAQISCYIDTFTVDNAGYVGPLTIQSTVPQCTLVVRNDGNGTTTPTGVVYVDSGANTGISATANSNYIFSKWTKKQLTSIFGDSTSASTTIKLNVSRDTITANFIDGTPIADYSSHFLENKCPANVMAGDTFYDTITYINTGNITWSGLNEKVCLTSIGPNYHDSLGVWFIMLPREVSVANGETYSYLAVFRAPITLGSHSYMFRTQRWGTTNDTTMARFGDTARIEFNVISKSPVTSPFDWSHANTVLDTQNMQYLGSFLPPNGTDRYTEPGISIKRFGTDSIHLLMGDGGMDGGLIREITVPSLVTPSDVTYANVNRSTSVKLDSINYRSVADDITLNGNFYFDNKDSTLYWTRWYFYCTNCNFPKFLKHKLNFNGSWSRVDYYYSNEDRYKGFWRGVTPSPKYLIDSCNIGRFAVGYGGLFANLQTAIRGPAIAFTSFDTTVDTLKITPALYYTDNAGAVRDGDYLNYIPYWNQNPSSIYKGYWGGKDAVHSGCFVDLPSVKGYIANVSIATGRVGYDDGGMNVFGHTRQKFYFYSLDTLKNAIRGGSKTPLPTAIRKCILPFDTVSYSDNLGEGHLNKYVTGMAFDSLNSRLYMYELNGQNWGYPVIHVFSINSTLNTPVITTHPDNDTTMDTARFSVTVTGFSLTYQWVKNNQNVGTNTNTYKYIAVDNDSVWCVVSNYDGSVTSNKAKVKKVSYKSLVFTLYEYNGTPKFKSPYNAIFYLDTAATSNGVWGLSSQKSVSANTIDSLNAGKGKHNRVRATTQQ